MLVYLGSKFAKYLCVVVLGLIAHEALEVQEEGSVQRMKKHWSLET